MPLWFAPPVRHPFFPKLRAVPAARSAGPSAALHGTLPELLAAAQRGSAARRAVFVTQGESEPRLSEAARDALWDCFQVPAYLLLQDRRRRVVGFECEARALHIRSSRQAADAGNVCACGRPGQERRNATAAPAARDSSQRATRSCV